VLLNCSACGTEMMGPPASKSSRLMGDAATTPRQPDSGAHSVTAAASTRQSAARRAAASQRQSAAGQPAASLCFERRSTAGPRALTGDQVLLAIAGLPLSSGLLLVCEHHHIHSRTSEARVDVAASCCHPRSQRRQGVGCCRCWRSVLLMLDLLLLLLVLLLLLLCTARDRRTPPARGSSRQPSWRPPHGRPCRRIWHQSWLPDAGCGGHC
jgi:hypothetical protein